LWSCALLAPALLLSGCASAPAPTVQAPAFTEHPEAPAMRAEVTMAALALLDQPYARGGRGPATGFDCSGLVHHVVRQATGRRLSGSAADLARQSRPIAREALQPGDLVFFNTLGAPRSHVGVYVGGGRFVHASNPRTGVRIDQLAQRYWAERFENAQRLIE
jgi:cell wall-associated NlpC family hydrolase